MSDLLLEWYESGNAPHEALGRAARRLMGGGALYLGGGVGVEKVQSEKGATTYALTGGAKSESFTGPLSAVIRAFAAAGASTAADTPGGAKAVGDPAAAARLRELADEEADSKRGIERYQRRIAAAAARPWTPGARVGGEDDWESRRIEELKANLRSIAAERSKLLAAGKVEEVEQARPGTNFTKVPAKNVAKLRPIIDHYKGMAHPFATCVRDQIKHGLSEDHANRRCAVVKDLGQGTTKWRKGSKVAEDALGEALGRVAAIEETLGTGMSVWLAEADVTALAPMGAALAEGMAQDLALLAIAEHPLGLLVFPDEVMEFSTPNVSETKRAGGNFDPAKHPRDLIGQFRSKVASLKAGESASLPDGHKVTRVERSTGRGEKFSQYLVSRPTDKPGTASGIAPKDPRLAAEAAIGRSMAATHERSLGGAKSYTSTQDLPGPGKMPEVPLGALVRGRKVVKPGDPEYDRLNKIVGPPEPGSPAAKALAQSRTPDAAIATRRERLASAKSSGEAERIRKFASDESFAGDVSAEHRQKWAALARDAEAKAKALRGREGRAREGERGEGVAMLVEAFSQSAPIQTPAKQDAERRVGKKAGSGGSKYDETKHKRAAAGQTGGGRFVSKGSSGEDVRAVQHRVGATPDGKFGEQTKRAIMEFQRAHGLQVDGVIGHQTAVAMDGGDGKNAQVGALKDSDKAKLKRLRKGGPSRRARGRRKTEMSRARGGAVV